MINWFGPTAWDAPLCTECPRCETPVGVACGRCGQRIQWKDRGITMPLMKADGSTGVIAFHLDCHLKSIMPHSRWASLGLVPNSFDGLTDGVFECRACDVRWTERDGWQRL